MTTNASATAFFSVAIVILSLAHDGLHGGGEAIPILYMQMDGPEFRYSKKKTEGRAGRPAHPCESSRAPTSLLNATITNSGNDEVLKFIRSVDQLNLLNAE